MFINYNDKFVNLGKLSLTQKLYPKDHRSEKLQIISGIPEQYILALYNFIRITQVSNLVSFQCDGYLGNFYFL